MWSNHFMGLLNPGSGTASSPGRISPGAGQNPAGTSPGRQPLGPQSGGSISYGTPSMGSLVGKDVRFNRGGPDAISGKLLAVMNGYAVVLAKPSRQIVYVNSAHIKSISEGPGQHSSGGTAPQNYIRAGSFNALLRQFTHQFVQVNNGGPEKVEGFVVEVSNNNLLLVVNSREVSNIPVFHIRSIRPLNQSGGKSQGKSGGKSKGKSSGKSRGK